MYTLTENSTRTGRLRKVLASAVIAVTVAAGSLLAASPANAISSISGPSTFYCNNNRTLSIPYPRVWASSRTEQVLWANTVQRWDAARGVWYTYNTFYNIATVNTFGQVVNTQSWVGLGGNTPAGSPINNHLQLSIGHSGHYRIFAAITGSQGGTHFGQYLAGGGYCTLS